MERRHAVIHCIADFRHFASECQAPEPRDRMYPSWPSLKYRVHHVRRKTRHGKDLASEISLRDRGQEHPSALRWNLRRAACLAEVGLARNPLASSVNLKAGLTNLS